MKHNGGYEEQHRSPEERYRESRGWRDREGSGRDDDDEGRHMSYEEPDEHYRRFDELRRARSRFAPGSGRTLDSGRWSESGDQGFGARGYHDERGGDERRGRHFNRGEEGGWGQRGDPSEGRYASGLGYRGQFPSRQGSEWRYAEEYGRSSRPGFGLGYGGQSDRLEAGRGFEYEARGPHAGRGPKGYQRSDERIREDVCDRLTEDPEIDASEISVSVSNGEVTLEGSVAGRRMKRAAEDCAEDIAGVKQVHNRLQVTPAGSWGSSGHQAGTSFRSNG